MKIDIIEGGSRMKVVYNNLTPAEVFELINRDDGRDEEEAE